MQNANQTNNAHLELIMASEIEPKEIDWLWYPFIPFGKVTLLQGDPGDGKSTFMLTIAALPTRGEPLPFTDKPHEPISVIYQTTEDDADDTIVPRFIKANGDRKLLVFISEKDSPLTFDDGRILTIIKQELDNLKELSMEGVASSSEIGNLKRDVDRYKKRSADLSTRLENVSARLKEVTEKYEKLAEVARPYLLALQHFPDRVKDFFDRLFSSKDQAEERQEPRPTRKPKTRDDWAR